MKNLTSRFIPLAILCIAMISPALKSQSIPDTVYLDEAFRETTRGEHRYLQVKIMKEDDYFLKTYYTNGQLRTESFWTGDDRKQIEGNIITYAEDGRILKINNLSKGTYEGEQKIYYDSGALYYVENYRNQKEHGERIVYYEDGSLKRKELFENGKLIYGNCYSMDGKDTTYFPFIVQPQFRGGESERIRYLVENIRYPRKARKRNISGIVYLTFLVRSDGEVTDVKILRGVHPLLDEEALRVVERMPKWTPGKFDGKKVTISFNMPIKFTLAR